MIEKCNIKGCEDYKDYKEENNCSYLNDVNKCSKRANFKITRTETWNPTCELTCYKKWDDLSYTHITTLKQKWRSNLGNEEWREIPTIEVNDEKN